MDNAGELYVIDINSISRWMNKRNKRLVDIILALLFLILGPVLVFFQKNPGGYFSNIFNVIGGRYSFVGYKTAENISIAMLPKIRPGILNPLDAQRTQQLDVQTIDRLNSLYAKDYQIYSDLNIIWKGIRNLGR